LNTNCAGWKPKFGAEKISRRGLLFALIISTVSLFVVANISSQSQIWAGDSKGNMKNEFAPDENGGSSVEDR
jgi:hypothetical protein